ncbi:hypothetical protein, partial [Escherichia coli]|uniref:hypothetical protein n=1 Tax=Escherichia coli TaxID=562 RepID=UPI0019D5EE8F
MQIAALFSLEGRRRGRFAVCPGAARQNPAAGIIGFSLFPMDPQENTSCMSVSVSTAFPISSAR